MGAPGLLQVILDTLADRGDRPAADLQPRKMIQKRLRLAKA